MKTRSLAYYGYETPDPSPWKDFGPEVLGLGLIDGERQDGTVYLRMDEKHHRFAIHPGKQQRLAYLGWELKDRDDFEEAIEKLDRAAVPYVKATDEQRQDRMVIDFVSVTDPAGFTHELFYGQGRRIHSYMPGRNHGGFVTGMNGMGHTVLAVPEGEEFHQFATGVLGMPIHGVLRRIPGMGMMCFYRNPCGDRHHGLAMLSFGPKRGVHHIMIECKELDDVGIAWTLAKRRGMHLPIDLGRHTDGTLSFYVETPSGFFIEYAYGSRPADVEYLRNICEHRHFGGGEPGSYWGHETSGGLSEAQTMPSNLL